MIKINLLPREKRTKDTHLEQEILILVLLIIVTAGLLLSVNFWLSSRVDALTKDRDAKQALERTLTLKVAKFKKLDKQIKEIEPKIKVIRTIRDTQLLPVRVMDELVTAVAGEKLWFESMSYDPKGVVAMNGVALDNQSLAKYIDALRKSPYVKGVLTQRTSRRDIQNVALVEFQCQVTTGAPDALPGAANATAQTNATTPVPAAAANATDVNATAATAVPPVKTAPAAAPAKTAPAAAPAAARTGERKNG